MKHVAVESSELRSVAYERETRVLEVRFVKGERYQYFQVPPSVFDRLLAAESKGRFFNEHVRNAGYRFERVGE